MGRKRSFLGFLATLFVAFFTANAFAEGYSCPTYKKYTECNPNYFLTGPDAGNSCDPCPDKSSNSDSTAKSCTCNTGHTVDGTPTGATNTTETACTAIKTTITLNNGSATTNGTSAIYATYNTNVYLDSSRSKAMTTSANAITAPTRKYTVTYNANGGSVNPASATATYTFNGYYSAATGGTQYIASTGNITTNGLSTAKALTANATWYTQWTPQSVTLPTPTRTGYTFNGWATSSTATSGTTGSYTPTADITLYATWTANPYTITLDGNGATANGTTAIYTTYNTNVYLDSSRSKAMTTSANAVTKPTRSYTVTYNANGGSVSSTSATATRTFNGFWSASSGGTKYIETTGYITSSGLTAGKASTGSTWYAQWTGGAITLPTPTRTGYTFNGWATSSTATSGTTGSYTPTADITLYATWTANTITLKWANGGRGTAPTAPASCTYDGTFTMPAAMTATGYTFNKWSVNGKTFSAGASVACTSANLGVSSGTATITGTWTQNTYDVAYDCGDGEGSAPSATKATYDSNFTPAANTCTRSGYNFAGWAVSGTSDTKPASTAFKWTYTADKTFTAKWTSESEKAITYDTQGGTINGSYTAACNVETATFTLPTNVTKPGYTFNGWYSAATGGTKVTSVTKGECTSALTFYAQWTECNSTSAGACNCGSSEYPLNGTCTNCSYSCASVTGYTLGTYNVCNAETNSICYRNCTTADVADSTSVSGTVTKGGTNTCKATACADDYYISGSGCQTCPDNATCGGDAEWSCDEGYQKTSNGLGCEPKTYTVTLDANGGTGGTTSVTVTFNSLLPTATMPTRDNYVFLGYYDTKETTGGNQYYDASGTPTKIWDTTNAGTLYARWELGVFTCTAGQAADGTTCSAGYYCPGETVTAGTETNTTSGCERACPAASGKTISSAEGSKQITDCTASGDVDITDETGETVSGSGVETCNWNGTDSYNVSCNTVPTQCNGGYYRPAANSPFCNPVGYGYYRAASEAVTAHNDCSDLPGAAVNVTTLTQTSSVPQACYNMCLQSQTADANGWLNPVNENEFYNGSTIPACTYTTSCNDGYKVSSTNSTACESKVLTITLNHNGGTSTTNTIYLKYNTGWYSDANASNKITTVALPSLAGQTCSGYLSENGDRVVSSTGNLTTNYSLFTDNATITASYDTNASITCAAGTYYSGTGTSCTNCPAGSYCAGVETVQDIGEAKGIASCASLNGTYTAATDANGNTLTVTISSAAKATGAGECYATNVAYAPNQYTTGSQTCKYDAGTKSYTVNCSAQNVITCAGGYAKADTSAIVCTIVGLGYYSPDKDTASYRCPINSDTGTYGTTQQTGRSSVEACIMDGLWYEPENGHNGQRRQCFYSETSKKYDRNCPQSTIVACDAGYWYNVNESTTDCVPVGNGYWSPAQSECSGEATQPAVAGCSTERNYCGDGVDTEDSEGNITETASSITYCVGLCEENYFCVPGEEAQSCSDATDGAYPYSAPGATSIDQCYAKVDNCSCIQDADGCKEKYGANSCMFSQKTFNGVKYYSDPDNCVGAPENPEAAFCDVSYVYCSSNSYFSPIGDLDYGQCNTCSSLSSEHPYSSGLQATQEKGPYVCYARVDLPCTPPVCPLEDRGTCDYNANHKKTGGGRTYYGSTEIVGGSAQPYTCPSATDETLPADWTCFDGYDKNIYGTTSEELCQPHTYTFVLDDTLGSGGDGEIYELYKTGWYADSTTSNAISQVTAPKLDNYSFLGYFTAQTYGTQVIDSGGRILENPEFLADTTLYAQWSKNIVWCEAGKYYNNGTLTDCVAPYYCPGEGNVVVGGTGCRETCPNGGTIDAGIVAESINSCHKVITDNSKSFPFGTALWDCYYTSGSGDNAVYSTSCKAVPQTCDGGYYYEGNNVIGCTLVENKYYSPDKALEKLECVGGDGSESPRDSIENCYVSCDLSKDDVSHSLTLTPDSEYALYSGTAYNTCTYTLTCETGYTAVAGANPKCTPKEYTITLDKNGGTGDIADSVKCTFDSGACALPATSGLSRPGYNVVAKWCTAADGSGVCYGAGNTITTNISATGTDTTLFAIWTPAVFKITLNATDATANAAQGPVYLKYNTGWYSDATAMTPITSLGASLPEKKGYVFAGYKLNDVSIVAANGALQTNTGALTVTTADATANVVWSAGLTTCAAGTYYSGNGSVCLPCTENNYCPGGDFATDSGNKEGLNPCPDGGKSTGGESAINVGVCYKEQLAYTSETKFATGTQTCYYGTDAYTENCKDIVVTACVAGYYWVSGADCDEVGANYYSGEGEMTRTQCPNGGGTGNTTTAVAVTECFKTVDFTSASGNGTGTQVCMYTSGDGNEARYATECREQYINSCKGGYYKTTDTAIDCDIVGQNWYSPDGDVARTPCPDNGLTQSETANAPVFCYRDTEYKGDHGEGVQVCYYNAETTKYDTNCDTVIFHKCDGGYYWAAQGDKDCTKVDYGFFGPVEDAGNSNRPTARKICPDNGLTKTDVSADVSECYRTDVVCTVSNGAGETTCNYDANAGTYSAKCEPCSVTGCGEGYYSVDGENCTECPENSVCDGTDTDGDDIPDAKTCAELTNGTHTKSDAGTSDVKYCYTNCPTVANATGVTGRDYYGVADTCKINSCKPGFKLKNFQCIVCEPGEICDGGDDNDGDGNQDEDPKTCTELTGGTHPMSPAQSSSIKDCYHMCEAYDIEGGTAVPVSEHAQYPDDCKYKGISDTGNPCDIVDDRCVETSCNSNFELINGSCKPCNREHAITYKPTGNCVVESCATGYHPNGQACEDDVVSCTAPNAISAKQIWDNKKNAFGECLITECEDGYHLAANTCQVDEQACQVDHGIGMREWNHNTNTWGECVATSCEPGYTNDRSLTNELSKQCGRCNNMYSALGELAVSSYVRECEIAACMYQGEKFTLENNECILICDTRSDETGSQQWNASRKKCERTCNDGYIEW